MEPAQITAPSTIGATCIECEEVRSFSLSRGDSDALLAVYECAECGHTARLALGEAADP